MRLKQAVRMTAVLAVALGGTGLTQLAKAATVTVDGQQLATSVAPIQRNGRTLVPMRDIFQALGASVAWNNQTQGITATRGGTPAANVGLQIGSRFATVNGRGVTLDQPAVLYRGNTMVPMRFVAEALGAQVNWNGATEVAAITTGNHVAVAGLRQISVPQGAVVKVTLDSALSSATARRGDRFTSTVVSQNPGDSEFPAGSKIEGVVSDATSQDGNAPGMLDLSFQSVVLPGGSRYPLDGSLIALDSANVDTSTPGRIMGKTGSGKDNKLVVIGIGAGVGFVLGKLIKQNTTLTTLLGAVAGYVIDKKKGDKNSPTEAMIPTNLQLGVRLNRSMTYADAGGYYNQRSTFYKM